MRFDGAEETDKFSLISFLPPIDLDVWQPVSNKTTILPSKNKNSFISSFAFVTTRVQGGLWHRIAYGVNLFYLIFIFVA